MSYFEFKPGEIISTVYTSYPTRSIVLSGSNIGGAPFDNADSGFFYIFASGVNYPGVGKRNFLDSDGTLVEQNFYISASVSFYGSDFMSFSSSLRAASFKLRNLYASNSFYKPQNYGSSSFSRKEIGAASDEFCLLTIPSFLIGSKIKPGSVRFYSDSLGPGASLIDDGYGGLYGDGVYLSSSFLAGCIMYEYGIIEFTKFSTGYSAWDSFFGQFMTLSFQATNNVPMNVYLCNSPKSKLNFSNNPSYTVLSGGRNEITSETPVTFTTTIGLYDENFELMGVAKVASPIKNEEKDSVQYRLKLNF